MANLRLLNCCYAFVREGSEINNVSCNMSHAYRIIGFKERSWWNCVWSRSKHCKPARNYGMQRDLQELAIKDVKNIIYRHAEQKSWKTLDLS